MSEYSSIPETKEHIQHVRIHCAIMAQEVLRRGRDHDMSKMETPEVEAFDIATPKLAHMTYGSEEYKQSLREMRPAIEHHHAVNRHHPEHFANGIRGMNLVDVVEMFCDWLAATKRMQAGTGNMMKSIELNQKRFGYSDDFRALLENTYLDIFKESDNAR
jgi:hypothetical protein